MVALLSNLLDPPDTGLHEEGVRGTPACAGVHEGTARIIDGSDEYDRLQPGDVLVSRSTGPAVSAVLPLIGAIVTDHGGVLSHPAIVAREAGLRCVVGCGDATTRIPDGARVRVDGAAGSVTILPD